MVVFVPIRTVVQTSLQKRSKALETGTDVCTQRSYSLTVKVDIEGDGIRVRVKKFQGGSTPD